MVAEGVAGALDADRPALVLAGRLGRGVEVDVGLEDDVLDRVGVERRVVTAARGVPHDRGVAALRRRRNEARVRRRDVGRVDRAERHEGARPARDVHRVGVGVEELDDRQDVREVVRGARRPGDLAEVAAVAVGVVAVADARPGREARLDHREGRPDPVADLGGDVGRPGARSRRGTRVGLVGNRVDQRAGGVTEFEGLVAVLPDVGRANDLRDVRHRAGAEDVERAGRENGASRDREASVRTARVLRSENPVGDVDRDRVSVVELDELVVVGAAVVVAEFVDDHALRERGRRGRGHTGGEKGQTDGAHRVGVLVDSIGGTEASGGAPGPLGWSLREAPRDVRLRSRLTRKEGMSRA